MLSTLQVSTRLPALQRCTLLLAQRASGRGFSGAAVRQCGVSVSPGTLLGFSCFVGAGASAIVLVQRGSGRKEFVVYAEESSAASAAASPAAVAVAAGTKRPVPSESAPTSPTDLRVVSLEELRQHRSADSCWVSYAGEVYDVTDFLKAHPGGHDPLLMAGGQAIEMFWEKYHIHYKTDKPMRELEKLPKVGRLSPEDAERALLHSDPENAACESPVQRSRSAAHQSCAALRRRHFYDIVQVGIKGPLWGVLRFCLRLLGALAPGLVDDLSRYLPVSLAGFGDSRRIDPSQWQAAPEQAASGQARPRVAVVGGGIAGVGCAYSLAKSGFDVVIFEGREVLGGNAQMAEFEVTDAQGKTKTVRHDLSVLYWVPEYYKNYMCLLKDLGIQAENVKLPYVVRTNKYGSNMLYTPPGSKLYEELGDHALEARFASDLRRFDNMTNAVSRAGSFFCLGDSSKSFYKFFATTFSQLNPFNYMTLRQTTKLFGISADFYETVIRPFHRIQFTTAEIDGIPGAAWGVLNDITPLTYSRDMMSWGPGGSQEVFGKAVSSEHISVRLSARVLEVTNILAGSRCSGAGQASRLCVHTEAAEELFDRVVFACPASTAAGIMRRGDVAAGAATLGGRGGEAGQERTRPAGWYERTLLEAVGYHDDYTHGDWRDWLEVPVHQDASASLPWATPEVRRSLLEHAAFIANDDSRPSPTTGEALATEYHCCLGSWSPAARAVGSGGELAPMFMTQSIRPETEELLAESPDKLRGTFSAPRSHPDMSIKNMAITQMLHLIQGRRGIYYCSNYTAPGNGHDLAFLSGVVVAHAIGAEYPFTQDGELAGHKVAAKDARRDFNNMRNFMGL